MTNPYTTGGGGTHFEARVIAYYLAAALCEAPARGVPGTRVLSVATQRAAFDQPMDDAVVTGQFEDGTTGALHLQVKSSLSFTKANAEWIAVVQAAWDTYQGTFIPGCDRLGVAVSQTSAKIDKHYQSVLHWARLSLSGADFIDRIGKTDFSSDTKKQFVDDLRAILDGHVGSPISDHDVWQIVRSFQIVHFDYAAGNASRDAEVSQDRLRGLLGPDDAPKAGQVWDLLVAFAGEMTPAAGTATRPTMIERLAQVGLPAGVTCSRWRDLANLERASRQALSDIRNNVHGLRLHRQDAHDAIAEALQQARFVQIDGEPGTGKSAILRAFAEEAGQSGTVFVLKDARIRPGGWAAHAAVLGIEPDLPSLLREVGGAGQPILFIDGVDKISDPAAQLTVNDLINAIALEPSLADWRVLMTVREQNLDHIATWLAPEALRLLPIRTVTVQPLTDAELFFVADAFPRLRPLLSGVNAADLLLRRLFFLDAILSLTGGPTEATLSATEAKLLAQWWRLGGSDKADFAAAQHRRNALLSLARTFAANPDRPIRIGGLPPEPLAELQQAGVIRDIQLGHTVGFTHDIYEEWALCQLLIGERGDIDKYLLSVGEPQALVRPTQLMASHLIEEDATAKTWRDFYDDLASPDLRPVWQRAVLSACLRTTRAVEALQRASSFLLESDGARLKQLLISIQTTEVVPNPRFLNDAALPDLDAAERVKLANHTAIPKVQICVRFLDWFMSDPDRLKPGLMPELVPLFTTWQTNLAGHRIRHCREIGVIANDWLAEFEAALHPDRLDRLRRPYGLRLGSDTERKLEDQLRTLFLASAAEVPALVEAYLQRHANSKREHMFRDKIVANSAALAKSLPSALVDYLIAVFPKHPKNNRDPFGGRAYHEARKLGFAGHRGFYPASPVQMPFLALLRLHEEQGLRLIHAFCNHAVDVWRWVKEHPGYREQPLTPLPAVIQFPWGRRRYWGDGHVYQWFRGSWGNPAIGSALMALEQWALEEAGKGRDLDELLQKVLGQSRSMAVVGIGVSLCLAASPRRLDLALPFVTCPQVWLFDLPRMVSDSSGLPANEMGDWHRYRHLLSAVRDLNRKEHRKSEIRSLVPYYVFGGDKVLRKQYLRGIKRLREKLPFLYAEERAHRPSAEALKAKFQGFFEQADPANWRVARLPDNGGYQFWNEAPSLQQPEIIEQRQEHEELNRFLSLSLWANKSLEADGLDGAMSLDQGLALAREIDRDDLFDQPRSISDFNELQRASAVAGAAFAVARFTPDTAWDDDRAAWCLSVIGRAATMPESVEDHGTRGSILMMHPVVLATYGYAALMKRGVFVANCQAGLFSLAVDASEGVVAAVAATASDYAEDYPLFARILLWLLLQTCIANEGAMPDFDSVAWDAAEATRNLQLLETAEAAVAASVAPALPAVPLPWVEGGEVNPRYPEAQGYERNSLHFLWHLAEKSVLKFPIGALLDRNYRPESLQLIAALVDMTLQEVQPPFASSRRDHNGHTPFEWVYAFFNWCGRVAAQLEPDEVRELFLDPIFAKEHDTVLLALTSFAPAFMIDAFLPDRPFREDLLPVWSELTEWVLSSPEVRRLEDDFLSNDLSSVALAMLFCVHRDFGPVLCGAEEGWEHLPKFIPCFARAVAALGVNSALFQSVMLLLKKSGSSLSPQPGLQWLLQLAEGKKADLRFWQNSGEEAVEYLKGLLERPGALKPSDRKAIATISDILVDNGVRGAGFLQQEQLRI